MRKDLVKSLVPTLFSISAFFYLSRYIVTGILLTGNYTSKPYFLKVLGEVGGSLLVFSIISLVIGLILLIYAWYKNWIY